ncbi:2-oxoglutarate (2OG) and Fe(II)-dependent oxygenase superfamily protein [Tanacetum coccineum]
MRLGAEVGAESGRFRCSSGWIWGLKWMWVLGVGVEGCSCYCLLFQVREARDFVGSSRNLLGLKSSCGCILSSHDGAWQDDTGSKEDSEDVDDEGIGCSPIIGMGNFSYIQPPQERFDSINEEPNQDSIPVIDMSNWDDLNIAKAICDAASKWGFFSDSGPWSCHSCS